MPVNTKCMADVEAVSNSGSEIIHKWMQELDKKSDAHAVKAVRLQKYAVTQRSLLITWCSATSVLAMTRFALYSQTPDFVYSMILSLTSFFFFLGFGIGWLEKSTFHLQMAHKLMAVKDRCYFTLKHNEFDADLKKRYESVMTQSNNLMRGNGMRQPPGTGGVMP